MTAFIKQRHLSVDPVVNRAFLRAFEQASDMRGGGQVGYGVVELRDDRGRVKEVIDFCNLITTAGDNYYSVKAIVGVSPASVSAPTAMSGMKLGTGTTAVAKSSTGANLVTYLTASNLAFDSSFPASVAVGGDAGYNSQYKTTWAAGVATNSAITEAVIVNDAATNATSTAANTIARTVFTAVNKAAGDSLAITWNHKFLGS